MSASNTDYSGYAWIEVPRYEDDPSLSWEERYQNLERHHIQETTFLINEVRKLAKELEELRRQEGA